MTPDAPAQPPTGLDTALLVMFLIGIYLGVSPKIAAGLPVPAAPAGFAGALLLVRHAHRIKERDVVALTVVVTVYLVSILTAPDLAFLKERFKGFIQLSYALIIGYAFFITMLAYDRNRLARVFLTFCVVVLFGCVVEANSGLGAISDAVRDRIYDTGIYRSDQRDIAIYGRVRPKLFTSEPSAVTFALTLYLFAWFVLSTWRWKHLGYLALLGVAFFVTPGPTLLLGFVLIVVYELILGARRADRSLHTTKLVVGVAVSVLLLVACAVTALTLYAERTGQIIEGTDPSFFYRVVGPALIAFDSIARYPIVGAGLTGEEFIERNILDVFMRSSFFSIDWRFGKARDVLTNYFWLHWTYLGMVWGLATIAALTWYLRSLAVPSAAFCWLVWGTFGQASGAYVSPKTWLVFSLAAGLAIMSQRQRVALPVGPRVAAPPMPGVGPRLGAIH